MGRELFEQFRETGAMLFALGLVGSHSGNLSVRLGSDVVITRHDARLGRLARGDLVRIRPGRKVRRVAPSLDLAVHLAIYKATQARAIVHAHPVHAVALSLDSGSLSPVDVEGMHHLGTVRVVGENTMESYRALPELLPETLCACVVAVHRGHGAYAIGSTMDEALHRTSALEFSSTVLALRRRGA